MTESNRSALAVMIASAVSFTAGQAWYWYRHTTPTPTPVEPPAIVEPVDAEAWIDRRLAIVNERCGPVPFRVSMTKEWIDIDCGRPANLGKVRVPRPEATATKIAEVKGVEVKP